MQQGTRVRRWVSSEFKRIAQTRMFCTALVVALALAAGNAPAGTGVIGIGFEDDPIGIGVGPGDHLGTPNPATPQAIHPEPIPAIDPYSDSVGATPGTTRVDESGASTYTVPIYVPPGTAGFVPSLSLQYSSRGSHGTLGPGWAVGGLSSISRCRKGKEYGDGNGPFPGVQFGVDESSNAYCLDGARLLDRGAIGSCPAAPGGHGGREFGVELDPALRVCAYRVTGEPTYAYWLVYPKDGSLQRFGFAGNSRLRPNNGSGALLATQVLTWGIDRIADPTGNSIDFIYNADQLNGEMVIAEVRYTGKVDRSTPHVQTQTRAPYNRIVFAYDTMPASSQRIDWLSGSKLALTKRLTTVEVLGTVNNGASPDTSATARIYRLDYTTATTGSQYSRLTELRECVPNGASEVCYPGTKIQWKDPDGVPTQGFSTAPTSASYDNTLKRAIDFKMGDVNGDGRQDLVWVRDHRCTNGAVPAGQRFEIMVSLSTDSGLSSPTGSGTYLVRTDPPGCGGDMRLLHFENLWHLFDYTGDGRDDLMYSNGADWRIGPASQVAGSWTFSSTTVYATGIPSSIDDDGRLVDLNGDGLADLLHLGSTGAATARFLERTPAATPNAYQFAATDILVDVDSPPGPPGPPTYVINGVTLNSALSRGNPNADIDGDGASDMVLRVQYINEDGACPLCRDLGIDVPVPAGTRLLPSSYDAVWSEEGIVEGAGQLFRSFWYVYRNAGIQPNGRLRFVLDQETSLGEVGVGMLAREGNDIQLNDLNADGQADVVYQKQINTGARSFHYRLNAGKVTPTASGSRFLAEQTPGVQLAGALARQVNVFDLNGDGRQDFVFPVDLGSGSPQYPLKARLYGATGYGSEIHVGNVTSNAQNPSLHLSFLIDVNGDGGPDLVRLNTGSDTLFIARNAIQFGGNDLPVKITNGLGAISQFQYAPITDASVYDRLFDGSRQRWGRESPVQDVFSAIWVVSAASQSAPTAGSANDQSIVNYRYRGARLQAGGRGFLGFKAIQTEDLQNLLVTTTEYRQDFPFIGRPANTVVVKTADPLVDACVTPDAPGCFEEPPCASGEACMALIPTPDTLRGVTGQTLSDADNQWSSVPAFAAGTVQSLAPYLADSVEQKFDLATADLLTHSVHSQFVMDGWGNLANSTVTSQRAQGGGLVTDETQTTTHIYGCTASPVTVAGCTSGLNVERQRLGRLSLSTVLTARPGEPSITRRASFEYDATTLLLVSEIQGPYDEEPVEARKRLGLRTDRVLDANGNRTLEVVCNTSNYANRTACLNLAAFEQRQWETDPTRIQRYMRWEYDTKGRFVLGVIAPFYDPNGAGHAIEGYSEMIGIDIAPGPGRVPVGGTLVPRRNAFGDPLNQYGATGNGVDIAYGAFGRERFRRELTGNFRKTTYAWCQDVVNAAIPVGAPRANCPVNAVFRVASDSLGTTGDYNGKSASPTQWAYFDRLGREMLKTTRIYQQSAASTSRWSSIATSYDLIGRGKTVTVPYFSRDPNGSQGTGRAGASLFGAPAQTTVEYDAIGRTDKTTNPETPINGVSESEFGYDALGIDVTNPRGKTITRNKNSRDETRSVVDAGLLTVDFTRNAVGNLKSVTRTPTDGDSSGVAITTTLVHDRLGRKTQIADPDKGTWVYTYNALGELIGQTDAKTQSQSLYRDALGRLIKRTETRRSSSGTQIAEPTSVWTWDTSPRPGDLNPALAGTPVLSLLHEETLTLGGFVRTYGYDDAGRIKNRISTLDGTAYTERQTYDGVGRAWQHVAPSTDPDAWLGTLNEYSDDGYPFRVRESSGGTTGQIYSEVIALSARGQVREERFHNTASLSTTRSYDDATGRLLTIQSGTSGAIQNWEYTYDKHTNLTSRWNRAGTHNIKETMTYDDLDRLDTISQTRSDGITTTIATDVGYDQLGNIKTKSVQVGTGAPTTQNWSYAGLPAGCSRAAGPHAVSQFGAATYCYDENGNQTLARYSASATRSITYTGYDLVDSIATTGVPSTATLSFKYAPDRSMWKRVDGATTIPPSGPGCNPADDRIFCNGFDPGSTGGTTGGSTTYTVANVEFRIDGSNITTKRYVGSSLVITTTRVGANPPTAALYAYLFRDALGSLDVVTNQLAQIQQRLSFDPWGQRRYADPPGSGTLWGILPASVAASFDTTFTRQGYTGHEQLDSVGLVHMKGRLYDPKLGRFIQADPFVESDTAQGLNRYSYVLNNPLSLTDPSGYITCRQVLGIVIAVVAAYFGQYYAANWALSFGIVVTGGFLSAYVATGSLRAGLWGAFAAGVFWGIGTGFSGVRGEVGTGMFGSGYTGGQYAAKVAAHGAAGGTLSELQGGKFGHGFASAGVTEALSPAIGSIKGAPLQAVTSAAVGGTASKLAGGSFSNGAITASFGYLFNQFVHAIQQMNAPQPPVAQAQPNAQNPVVNRTIVETTLDGLGDTYLDSEMSTNVDAWIADAHSQGVDLIFNSAYRDPGAQAALQNDPNAITPATTSLHSAGLAVDVNYSSLQDIQGGLTGDQQRDIIRTSATTAGLSWGGNFRTPDPPHFYMDPGGNRASLIQNATNQIAILRQGNGGP